MKITLQDFVKAMEDHVAIEAERAVRSYERSLDLVEQGSANFNIPLTDNQKRLIVDRAWSRVIANYLAEQQKLKVDEK